MVLSPRRHRTTHIQAAALGTLLFCWYLAVLCLQREQKTQVLLGFILPSQRRGSITARLVVCP